MNQPMGSKPEIETLPGEKRGIASVNHDKSSTAKRALILLIILILCAVAGILYWKYRRYIENSNQVNAQKDLHLTSTVNAKTFVDPPAKPKPVAAPNPLTPPPLPGMHMLDLHRNSHNPSAHSHKNQKSPPVLDKAGSSLMAVAAGSVRENSRTNTPSESNEPEQDQSMTKVLSGTSTPMRHAEQLSNRNFVLAKGSFIDCALQTKLDSTVPGMTACVVTRNIYSDNGKVVLIERGSTVSGEYKSNLRQGMARIFVLWTRIKTPNGVIVNLDSPGTDQLGGAGVPGYVDNHFWQRFGGALLLSLVDDVATAASSRLAQKSEGMSFEGTFGATQDMSTEALKNTINIPPTLYKNQGEQIGIYVARDLDFSSVYDVTSN